jgi:GTP pyrophosphokinase
MAVSSTNQLAASPVQDRLVEAAAQVLQNDETRVLIQALRLAAHAYGTARHESSEPLVDHAAAVAHILLDYNLDLETIAAAVLQDTVEQTEITIEQIKENFGEGIACLVDGAGRLPASPDKAAKEKKQAENLRKLILATATDVRVMLLRLAEQLHIMRTIHRYPSERQVAIARETQSIYAPIAERLGISKMQAELEDMSFAVLSPEAHEEIEAKLYAQHEEHQQRLDAIRRQFLTALHKAGMKIKADDISTRQKHIYSIHRKMHTQKYYGKDVWRIYDRLGIRVIVPTVQECYQVLGVVHSLWKAVPDEFDDYISNPRPTGYQSLHTAVQYNPDNPHDIVEVQIRTPNMHEQAEYGVAAHWRYKGSNWQGVEVDKKTTEWIRRLLEIGREYKDPQDFVEAAITDVFADRVYVFTPEEDILDLPTGATPIDFAYHVHTDIGHRCRGAKVNGKLMTLTYKLQTGDKVEIITAKRGGPSRDWLNPDYTKTKRATAKIRQWFRRQDREKIIAQGREVVDRELKRLGLANTSQETVRDLFGYKTVDSLLAAVGYGDINTEQIATKLLEAERERERQPDARLEPPVTRAQTPQPAEGINIMGTEGLLVHLAKCCNPVPGDPIIGFITRGRGVTVHRTDCSNVVNIREPERLTSVSWGAQVEQIYQVPVLIKAHNREGLFRDIGTVVADLRLGISNMNASTSNNVTTLEVTLEMQDPAQLSRVFNRILQIPNVIDVSRRTP